MKNVKKSQFKSTGIGFIPVDWDVKTLGELCSIEKGQPITRKDCALGNVPVIAGGMRPAYYHNKSNRPANTVTISGSGANAGYVGFHTSPIFASDCSTITKSERYDVHFLYYSLLRGQDDIYQLQTGGAQPHVYPGTLKKYLISVPRKLEEQKAIAAALSDVDGLIDSIERLIAKKRDMKTAAMQQLLAGKTRLPGFTNKKGYKNTDIGLIPSDWDVASLGDISDIKTGTRNNQDKIENGAYPFYVRSSSIERIDGYSHNCEAVLIPGDGRIGTIFHYINGCFDFHQRVYAITKFSDAVKGKYMYYYLVHYFGRHAFQNTVKATVDSLRLPTFKSFQVATPKLEEQTAIATILSDMDAEIDALEQRLAKARSIKAGMMQELLTGNTRLVKPVSSTEETKAAHNPHFEDAVIIAVLADAFGSVKYPLGRMRYTKLSYLLHRHQAQNTENYLKKAAGPYNPQTKYGGAEKIALSNQYIAKRESGKYKGFIAAENVAEARGYFTKWFGDDALQWLEQFRYNKNPELELLSTVDMAVCELRESGREVSVAAIKAVLQSDKEWKPKLKRAAFSDDSIADAMRQSAELFGD